MASPARRNQPRKSRVRSVGEAFVVLAIGIIIAGAALSGVSALRSGATNSACDRAASAIKDANEAHRLLEGTYAASTSDLLSRSYLRLESGAEVKHVDDSSDVLNGAGWSIVYHYVAGPPPSYWLESFGCK